MKFLKSIFLFCIFFTTQDTFANDFLAQHCQLLVVTTEDWDANRGRLQLYERGGNELNWKSIEEPIPVVIGKTGLTWGIGLHPNIQPHKKEGDKKSPAGIFTLGTVFGFASHLEMSHLKMHYLQLDEFIEAVDDLLSVHYNCIINSKELSPDWCSSEKMRWEPLYKIGITINHNFPNPQPGAGSAIFFHIWRSEHSGTAGCTAMSEENLATILAWLDINKQPLLIQLPIHVYHELRDEWHLP